MIVPTTKDAFKLLMMGEKALTEVSINGFKVDVDYYKTQKPVIQDEISRLKTQIINESEIGRAWKERFGNKLNLDSNDQLKQVLEYDMHFDKFKITEKGGKSADSSVIEKLPTKKLQHQMFSKFYQIQSLHRSFSNSSSSQTV